MGGRGGSSNNIATIQRQADRLWDRMTNQYNHVHANGTTEDIENFRAVQNNLTEMHRLRSEGNNIVADVYKDRARRIYREMPQDLKTVPFSRLTD